MDAVVELASIAAIEEPRFLESCWLRPFLRHSSMRMGPATRHRTINESATKPPMSSGGAFAIAAGPRTLLFRARLDLTSEDARYRIDLMSSYSLDRDEKSGEPSLTQLEDFVNHFAIPTIRPFIREALHETARRIGGNAPVLELLPRANMQVDLGRAATSMRDEAGNWVSAS